MSYQAYLDTIEKQTSKTPAQIVDIAIGKGFNSETKTGEIVTWLKDELSLGHGHAMAMAGVIKNGPIISNKHVGTSGPHNDGSDTLRLDGIANRDS